MTSWIFQANPDNFDVDEYLKRQRTILWTVNQENFASKMLAGDRVYLWRAAGKSGRTSGIIAAGHFLSGPSLQAEDPAALALWASPPSGKALRVRILIDDVAGAKEVLKRQALKADPILHALRILKFASETNYLLTEEHAESGIPPV